MTDSSRDIVLKNPPCLRTALMWGIATGALIGAHRFRLAKNVRKAGDAAIGAFGVVSGVTWVFCRAAYKMRAQQTREFMEVMNNPERKAEAEQFLRSRVQTKPSDDEK